MSDCFALFRFELISVVCFVLRLVVWCYVCLFVLRVFWFGWMCVTLCFVGVRCVGFSLFYILSALCCVVVIFGMCCCFGLCCFVFVSFCVDVFCLFWLRWFVSFVLVPMCVRSVCVVLCWCALWRACVLFRCLRLFGSCFCCCVLAFCVDLLLV